MSQPITKSGFVDQQPQTAESERDPSPEENKFSIRNLAVRGSIWSLGGFGASNIIRLSGNLILTRLLFPEAFGIMALIEMVMHGVQMVSDLGIAAGIISHPKGEDKDFLNTAWTLQVIRGCCLWLCTCIIAYPVSTIYDAPVLLKLLPFTGLSALVNGFNSTSVILLRRRINIKPLVIWETASQVLGLLCMICLAWYMRSVWALAIGSVFRMTVAMLSSQFLISRLKVKFAWNRSAVNELVRFGKWIFLATAVTFIINQGDRALLGLYVTKQTLGLYAIATVWSRMGVLALNRLNAQVLFPLYSALVKRSDPQLRDNVLKIRLRLAMVFVPLAWVLSIFGQRIIDMLYDGRYADAGWMLQFLAIGGIGMTITATSSGILLAAGDSFRHMVFQISRSLMLVASIIIGAYFGGTKGLIICLTISRFLDYPVLVWAIKRYSVWFPYLDMAILSISAIALFAGHLILN
jgi:O-antigen/teichoic acid export membrane protein